MIEVLAQTYILRANADGSFVLPTPYMTEEQKATVAANRLKDRVKPQPSAQELDERCDLVAHDRKTASDSMVY